MRFLVVGCNGMAGHIISIYLREQGYNVVGFAREKSFFIDTVIGDVLDFEHLKNTIIKGKFDTVINCVGLLNQFAENNHAKAVLINGYIPHYLAEITKDTDIQIVQMSTDCVFSGKIGGYTESSTPDGILFYDKSKAIGELDDKKNITFRNSIVGPDINESGIGLLNWFLKQKGTVKGFKGAIWTGQTTLQLAKTIEIAAKTRAFGLYNMVPDKKINKYELLLLFNKYIRSNPITIVPVDNIVVDKSLVRTRFKGFQYCIPDYETMIKDLGDWMQNHKKLYPHYNL